MADEEGEARLREVNAALERDGYPPIKRLPVEDAAITAWKRFVDAKRELEETGKLSDAVLDAVGNFCHCYKCPTYPRGERAIYCLRGKSGHGFVKLSCHCPSCEVYRMGAMTGADYFCAEGAPGKKLAKVGGAVEAARKLLDMELEKGNPGKRLPERLMAPPQLIGRSQEDVDVPEKVPGT